MAIRGETVGAAYVRLLIDGSGLDESIREELREAEPGIRAMGDRSSKEYADAFWKNMKGKSGQKLTASLEEAIGRADSTQAFFGTQRWRDFTEEMQRRFGVVGERAVAEMEESFRRKGNLSGLLARIQNIYADVARATELMTREQDRQIAEMIRGQEEYLRNQDAMMNQAASARAEEAQELFVSDIGISPRLSAEQYGEIYQDIAQTLGELLEEEPDAGEWLKGRTFARTLH